MYRDGHYVGGRRVDRQAATRLTGMDHISQAEQDNRSRQRAVSDSFDPLLDIQARNIMFAAASRSVAERVRRNRGEDEGVHRRMHDRDRRKERPARTVRPPQLLLNRGAAAGIVIFVSLRVKYLIERILVVVFPIVVFAALFQRAVRVPNPIVAIVCP